MRRIRLALICGMALLGIVTAPAFHPLPKLIWNASASVRIGLYAMHPIGALHVRELVLVRPPQSLARFMARRRYLPLRVPLLKHIAALPEQTVCRHGGTITVGGHVMGVALRRDWQGKPLPVWQGCRLIAPGQVFLMNLRAKASFDGRYFGPLSSKTIVGPATPIWLDPVH